MKTAGTRQWRAGPGSAARPPPIVMDTKLKDRLYDQIERQQTEVDSLRRQRDEAEGRALAAKADADYWRGKAAEIMSAVRGVVNVPNMPRDQVQSRLLVLCQKYENL